MPKCQQNNKKSCTRFTIVSILFVILAGMYVHKSIQLYELSGKDELKDMLLKRAVEQYSHSSSTQNKEILKQVKSEGERSAVIRGFISQQINELQGGTMSLPTEALSPEEVHIHPPVTVKGESEHQTPAVEDTADTKPADNKRPEPPVRPEWGHPPPPPHHAPPPPHQ